jgi:uncharacterized protein (DUF1800 family)
MTELHETSVSPLPEAAESGDPEATAERRATSRRAILGTGLTGALGIGGAVILAAIGTEATAAPASAATPKAASGVVLTNTRPKVRSIASRPYAHGGPVDRDQSSAETTAATIVSVPVGKQYTTIAAAIAAATPVASTLFDVNDHYLHLLRRATFGPRPADIADVKKHGMTTWLKHQLSPSSIDDPDGASIWRTFPLAGASAATINRTTAQFSWDAMLATAQATLGLQVFSKRQLFETVADVMSAHLHVAVPGEQWNTSPGYVKNVVRKYAFGKYRDMLLAAMKHPAMLNFLSNDQSDKDHVNENLGRELLELHTVGVASGYTEDMVKASARILSGRTIDWQKGSYVYDKSRHATGGVVVLGFTSENATASGGEAVGDAYLRYLATHPGTARTIARKLAVRFVSDQPSADLVQRLADVYLANDTSIVAVVKAIFYSSDFWSSVGLRMRRPLEDTVGAARVLNVTRGSTASRTRNGITNFYWQLWNQNNAPLGWNPPNGYPDVAAAWLGAGSMIDRWNTHRALANGWWGNLKYTTPQKLVSYSGTTSASRWVDLAALRLVGRKLSDDHRAAVIAAMGMKPTDTVAQHWWMLGEGIALILDSAYFQLR